MEVKVLEGKKVKKISLVLVLTLVLISAFAAVALADTPIHSGYTANTDACASCHSVHNAAEGADLLKWIDISTACMACHDGTVTATYNVRAGHVGDAVDAQGNPVLSNGGLFAVLKDGNTNSASQHDVFTGIKVGTAPGGQPADQAGNNTVDQYGEWTSSFSCASCHDPHSTGGNPRLLHPNPNLVMSQGTSSPGVQGALLGDFQGDQTPKYYFSAVKIVANATKDARGTLITSLTGKVKPNLGSTISVYINGGTKLSSSYYSVKFDVDNTNPAKPVTKPYVIFNKTPPISTGAVTVDYTPVLIVDMTIANKLQASEAISYISGMTDFCSACHTDYNGKRSVDGVLQTGKYATNGYHHSGDSTNSSYPQLGNYGSTEGSCLTCHYAHGVDQDRWAVTAARVNIAEYNSPELSGSSMLKRLPNSGTCETCHNGD